MTHPYEDLPDRAFWRRAVAGRQAADLAALFAGIPGLEKLSFATGGSCFAQHLGRAMKARGLGFMDYEPAPEFLSPELAQQHGYGIYSCRYGNIYTARQLRQLFDEAFGQRQPQDIIWKKGARFFDALRPGVEAAGFASAAEVATLRQAHLSQVKKLFSDLDLFVFTLGLTEAWVSDKDDTVYPLAPGVVAGDYNPERYGFKNFRYGEIYDDLAAFLSALRAVNGKAKLLLTVSPVPLAATASGEHVLVATTYSKSVLRAVAGDLAKDFPGVFYFPSYEIITGQPSRHAFYGEDLRQVTPEGVATVMRHFFGDSAPAQAAPPPRKAKPEVGFEHCEESLLDQDDDA